MRLRELEGVVVAVAVSCGACDRSTSPTSSPATHVEVAPPPPAAASTAAPLASASAGAPVPSGTVSFDGDPAGGPSPAFEAVVGDWYVADEAGVRGLRVDGSKWRNGTPSVNLAEQAKRMYGERYAEFLDGVKAFAFFPLAIHVPPPPTGDFQVTVKFYPVAGQIDQAAGVAFGIEPDGSYQGVRANALEDNLLYFRVVKGKRTVLDDVRSVPTPTRTWHTLSLSVRGKQLTAEVDGVKRLDKTLDAAPRGRVGLWSKADSQVLFDDFAIKNL